MEYVLFRHKNSLLIHDNTNYLRPYLKNPTIFVVCMRNRQWVDIFIIMMYNRKSRKRQIGIFVLLFDLSRDIINII